MQYVFNPRSNQINPVTSSTFVDPTLRDKVVSSELYALVCQRKVTIEDIASLFAVNKSPEILLKNYRAVKDSPVSTAPKNAATVKETVVGEHVEEGIGLGKEEASTTDSAFDGKELCSKKQAALLIIANNINCPELSDPDFAPTRPNLIKAIRAKADAAEAPKE